jgi:hypothetical protein
VTVAAIAGDETLVVLRIAFLALLYLFVILIARTATKDLGGAPQESIVLGAREAEALRAELGRRTTRLRVLAGPGLREGRTLEIAVSTVLGRDTACDVHLDGDDYASARHARLEPRPDGVWVVDLGSTNGTFVNDERVARDRLLRAGDVLRIGQTELEVET